MSILGFGLWASSGPFPLSAHYGLYKRGRDPPTNPSRHLKKKECSSLKWLLKEDQGRRPTAASAAAAAPSRSAAVPAAETAASPCLGRYISSCRLPAAAAATSGRRCRRRIAAPPSPPFIPSSSPASTSLPLHGPPLLLSLYHFPSTPICNPPSPILLHLLPPRPAPKIPLNSHAQRPLLPRPKLPPPTIPSASRPPPSRNPLCYTPSLDFQNRRSQFPKSS